MRNSNPGKPTGPTRNILRLQIKIYGAVQGVGFRPFVYRLANSLHLRGWVSNSSQGVALEVEGSQSDLETFLQRLEREKPPHASIHSLESSYLDPVGFTAFEIRASKESGSTTAVVLPDIATCPECLAEIFDSSNRRFRYPFTNCTNCGPRFSIIEALPYDRPSTTMKIFEMCDDCRTEYEDPGNRRFHAQPNACPVCGPHLELWNAEGNVLATNHPAILETAIAIRNGLIVAVKGLGGFHLMVDASNEGAVRKLRKRKQREEKPFALMYPSLEQVKSHCEVSPPEQRLLLSAASPIVLLKKKSTAEKAIVSSIAPGNPYLGIMLPYTPLHHLLMKELGIPVVATSGNLSDEPICIDEQEALERLGGIADVFLVHDRPIIRHVDDSIVRLIAGREMILRRARGYAPLPLPLKEKSPPILAVGAHLKNSVALSVENQVFISQHIGDLETDAAFRAFEDVIESFKKLYDTEPACVACDAHPDYLSTQYANRLNIPKQAVQHHLAHVLGCMLENGLNPPLLGVSWDGTGYGLDGGVWGGEFFLIEADRARRIGRFREFPLPGGETAIKEPRRTALGLLFEMGENALDEKDLIAQWQPFSEKEISLLRTILQKKINSPFTSSAGRLFDAVASLCGIRHINRFEGQAAMELEFQMAGNMLTDEEYQFRLKREGAGKEHCYIFNWEPMIRELLEDIRKKRPVETISAKFHNTLTSVIVETAMRINTAKILLSGGCFQNKYLSETTIDALRRNGFQVYWHQRVPPNDGGIALGQIAAAIQKNDFFKL